MAITYAVVLPRQTLASTAETFQITRIPQNGSIEKLIFKVDMLQAGATDSTDLAVVNKLDVVRVYGGSIKSEVTHSDLVRMDERIWNCQVLHHVGEDDNEGIAMNSIMPLNHHMDGSGNINFAAPFGAPPGSISMIEVVTAADQTATDTGFLTVIAVVNTAKMQTSGWVQYKRKLRTGVAGAFEFDPILDIHTLLGHFQFLTTGVKDATTAIPAALSVRGVALTIGRGEITSQVPADALTRGGSHWMLGSATATNVTVANYDNIWWDFGIRSNGRPAGDNWEWKVEEGASDARRSYTIGLGS